MIKIVFLSLLLLSPALYADQCSSSAVSNLSVCSMTEQEYQNAQNCGLISAASRHIKEVLCPSNKQNDIGRPIVTFNGLLTKGKNGVELINTYLAQGLKIELREVRGGKGTYCVYEAGSKCDKPTSFEGTQVTFSPEITKAGAYIVEVVSSQNQQTTFQEFSTSLKAQDPTLCLAASTEICEKGKAGREEITICDEEPASDEWVAVAGTNGTYSRSTGVLCEEEYLSSSRVVVDLTTYGKVKGTWVKDNSSASSALSVAYLDLGGTSCDYVGQQVRDSDGHRWKCTSPSSTPTNNTTTAQSSSVSESSILANTAGRTPASTAPCVYFNYTSTNGNYRVGQLDQGKTTTRKIIDRTPEGSSLISQTIGCENGTLYEVSNSKYSNEAGKCLYYDYISTDGTKNTKYLNEGDVTSRRILENKNGKNVLVSQNIQCQNNQLLAVDLGGNTNGGSTGGMTGGGSSAGGGSTGGGSSAGGGSTGGGSSTGGTVIRQFVVNGQTQNIQIKTIKVLNVNTTRELYINGASQGVSLRTLSFTIDGRLIVTTK
jgi:uncharacterized membrane protein YgcG